MLKDVVDTQKVLRSGTDDLQELRQMIEKTKNNIATHITTVDQLKTSLINITEKSKDVLSGNTQFQNQKFSKGNKNFQSQKSLLNSKMQLQINKKSDKK